MRKLPGAVRSLHALSRQAADFGGGDLRTFRQLADLRGDHREALAVFASARRLNRRIQGQEVCLAGNLFDNGAVMRLNTWAVELEPVENAERPCRRRWRSARHWWSLPEQTSDVRQDCRSDANSPIGDDRSCAGPATVVGAHVYADHHAPAEAGIALYPDGAAAVSAKSVVEIMQHSGLLNHGAVFGAPLMTKFSTC